MHKDGKLHIPPAIYVLLGVLLWSTGGLFIKLTSLDAFTVNMGRSLLAAVAVGLLTYKKGLRIDKFTIFTSLLYAGTLTCFVYANKTTTAANAIFLQYTAPIYILVLSPFILKEKFDIRDLVTVVICLGGMLLFFIDDPNASTASAPNIFLGNIVALVSGLFFGLYFIFLRHPRASKTNPAISVFYGNIFVVLLMAPLVASNPPAAVTNIDIGALLYLGIFQIGIAYMLFTTGVAAGVRPMDASIIGFFEPLFNPVWVYLFLGERPSNWAIAGGLVILFAVGFHTLRQYARSRRSLAAG